MQSIFLTFGSMEPLNAPLMAELLVRRLPAYPLGLVRLPLPASCLRARPPSLLRHVRHLLSTALVMDLVPPCSTRAGDHVPH